MNLQSRWPSAALMSALCHAVAIAVVVWLGVAVVEEHLPRAPLSIVQVAGEVPRPASGPPATIRFTVPKPSPAMAPPAIEPDEPAEAPRHVASTPVHRPAAKPSTKTAKPTSTSAPAHVASPASPVRVNGTALADELRAEATRAASTGASAAEESAVDYMRRLEARLAVELERIPGFDDQLRVETEYHIRADGRIERPRVIRASRDPNFDRAVLQVLDGFEAGPRPAGVDELQHTPFVTRAR